MATARQHDERHNQPETEDPRRATALGPRAQPLQGAARSGYQEPGGGGSIQGQQQAGRREGGRRPAGAGGQAADRRAHREEEPGGAQGVFQACKQQVDARLQRLDQEVNATFDQGANAARQAFEDYVGQRMDAYKAARYSGADGALRWVKDKVFGMPSDVNAFYNDGKDRYLAAMEATLDRVAGLVEAGLREATAEVARGKAEVQRYVASLPASLRQVGQEAQQQIQGQFDQLAQRIKSRRGRSSTRSPSVTTSRWGSSTRASRSSRPRTRAWWTRRWSWSAMSSRR